MAVLNYAEQYQSTLFETYIKGAQFADLWNAPNNGKVKFTGAKTVHIPSITTSGAVDVNRDAIAAFARNVDNSYQSKTLQHDRQWSTFIDPMDMDETNEVATIANITSYFNQYQKVPELDKYMISKLYSDKNSLDGSDIDGTTLTSSNVLDIFDNFMRKMTEGEVPDDGRLLYVSPIVAQLLKDSGRLTRYIQTNASNAGDVNRQVSSLDGVPVIQVPSNRMMSAYDFTNGASTAGGAEFINMALVHPSAILSPMKYDFVGIEEPSAHSGGKFLYYERFYCDVFLLNNRTKAIQMNVTSAAPALA